MSADAEKINKIRDLHCLHRRQQLSAMSAVSADDNAIGTEVLICGYT